MDILCPMCLKYQNNLKPSPEADIWDRLIYRDETPWSFNVYVTVALSIVSSWPSFEQVFGPKCFPQPGIFLSIRGQLQNISKSV